MVQRLGELGVPVDFDAVLEIAGDAAVGRPHVARALLEAGQVGSVREAFDRWLGDGKPACVEKLRISPAEAVQKTVLFSIPLVQLSGFAFPVESFSAPVHAVSLAFPSTPGIQGFIALNQMGARWSEVTPQLAHLAILFAGYAAFAWFMPFR